MTVTVPHLEPVPAPHAGRGRDQSGDHPGDLFGEQQIGDHEAAVYRYATGRGEITSLPAAARALHLPVRAVAAAAGRLSELHLLRHDDSPGLRLVPVDPDVAANLLVAPLERAMYQRREQADRLRDRIGAIARPDTDPDQLGGIDALEGAAEIRGLLKLAGEVCRGELVVLRPGHDDEDLVDELLDACYSVLPPGVSVRVVCPHRSRAGFASRARVRRLTEEGAQIRTLSEVPQAAVVFDGALAVVFGLPEGGGRLTARRVRDRDVVRFLVDMFDQLWENATPFDAEQPGYAEAGDDLQQSMVRLMAQGLTDEVVARRLGMSVRTCRRHIAALLQNLDAVSRFQAGVQAAGRFPIAGV